jgi:hypothetical protein
MGFKSFLAKPYASVVAKRIKKWSARPLEHQRAILSNLLENGRETAFGDDHGLKEVVDHQGFKEAVPIRDYEGLKPYVDRIVQGGRDILWPGQPAYFAKTSGTTSGEKYIPITPDSIPNHIDTAKNALLSYIAETGNSKFVDGKLIFLSGSPELEQKGDILTGRLSGIVNHHVPGYLRTNQLPSYDVNCMEDWEAKVDAIVEETWQADMRLISGIPPWVQMYFDRLQEKSGKDVGELFRNLSLFVHGGVNFEPYRARLEESLGRRVDAIETYPASEGFIAFQDSQEADGLLLNLNSGIFFEFIPMDQFHEESPERLPLWDVKTGVNYAIVLNSNAGLWGYLIGDTVEFVSTAPYRLKVTGRVSHFISAFGEHVIGSEVEEALLDACTDQHTQVIEFTVAPQVTPANGELPYHEWLIEFGTEPDSMSNLAAAIDANLQARNSYYEDLVGGNVLQQLKITPIKQGGFQSFMASRGKLGGQNKVPRLSNDRQVADELRNWKAGS